jgi:hypothetical protein
MAGNSIADFAAKVVRLKMFPYFDIASYLLICSMVREDSHRDPTADPQAFSRKHPLSCWLSSMLMCFAGAVLTNLLTGESPTAPFSNHRDLLLASLVWYAINYTPFDLTYKFCKFLPIKVTLNCLKEVQHANKVHHGVTFGLKYFPYSYPLVCLFGVVKGSGVYFMRFLDRLVRGVWIPTSHEFLIPSLSTKASLYASIAFILHHVGWLTLEHQQLYLWVVIIYIATRILSLLVGIHDPFLPFENLFCGLFFGGVADALKNAVQPEKLKTEEVTTGKGLPNKLKDE